MSAVLAIDPGPVESAYVLMDDVSYRPRYFNKIANEDMSLIFLELDDQITRVAIEMVASYGMPVGAEVFETCVWIGRLQQTLLDDGHPVELVKRHPVKLHHCHSARATDANITQALVDRFAPGQPNRGKGTKTEPGWFYGFSGDVWQAYALAVYAQDKRDGDSLYQHHTHSEARR